jgi:hypothetical protein
VRTTQVQRTSFMRARPASPDESTVAAIVVSNAGLRNGWRGWRQGNRVKMCVTKD